MVEIMLNGMEISLALLLGWIFWSLFKESQDGESIGIIELTAAGILTVIAVCLIVMPPEEIFNIEKSASKDVIFLVGTGYIFILYIIFFVNSLAKMKLAYISVSRINTDILLLLGVLFTYKYTDFSFIEVFVLVIVICYIVLTLLLPKIISKNNKTGWSATTYTLKKGYLLNIEEVDKEISLLLIAFFTIVLSFFVGHYEDTTILNENKIEQSIPGDTNEKDLKGHLEREDLPKLPANEILNAQEDNKTQESKKAITQYQPGLEKSAHQKLFNYQLVIFVLALLMLIFSLVKFSIKHDELTKEKPKRVILASRGRYGEYYGCNNTLTWRTRRISIRKLLKIENQLDLFVTKKYSLDEDSEGFKIEWDLHCQLASAYYSHAISLLNNKGGDIEKFKDKEKNQYIEYLLKSFFIYDNLPIIKPGYSDEYYHYIDVCNDLELSIKDPEGFIPPEDDAKVTKKLETYVKKTTGQICTVPTGGWTIPEDWLGDDFGKLLIIFIYNHHKKPKSKYTLILGESINNQYNNVLTILKDRNKKSNSIASLKLESINRLNNIVQTTADSIEKKLKDYTFEDGETENYAELKKAHFFQHQINAAIKHTKTNELRSAIKNAYDFNKLRSWISEAKFATGHIHENIDKFKAQRFDAPANLFITIMGVIFSIVAIIVTLEIFDYSKVVNIEIFALSGGVVSMIFAFIFKNTIESFFSSIEMYLSDMLRVGDRVKCKALDVDGYVSGFGFSSIEFKNLDNSRIKVPAKDLIQKTFANMRNISKLGRKIEIKLTFSANSIRRFSSDRISNIDNNLQDMAPYLECKLESISKFNCEENVKCTDNLTDKKINKKMNLKCYEDLIDDDTGGKFIEKRFLTNLGSFRAYAEQYLFEHQWLNDNASPMVVIGDTSAEGVTVLFGAYSQPDDRFVRTKAFMNLQSDIVEHLIATSQYFDLKLHQSESESGAGVVEKYINDDDTASALEQEAEKVIR